MHRVTLRLDDDLASAIKRRAEARDESVNAYASRVLRAAVDSEFSGTEAEGVRARFAAAGILAQPSLRRSQRPNPEALEAARRAAAKGTLLSDLISDDRDSAGRR